MKEQTLEILAGFFGENPRLEPCREAIRGGVTLLTACFKAGGKLLVCGNGGSCADSDHIVGELMKGFLLKRPLPRERREMLKNLFGEEGESLADRLQEALPAVSMGSQSALLTAIGNDIGYDLVFAQQVMGYGRPGDVLLAISTSGNASNVKAALMTAKSLGVSTIALTGEGGGAAAPLADVRITVPDSRTFRVQEYHCAVCHLLCGCVEAELFEG